MKNFLNKNKHFYAILYLPVYILGFMLVENFIVSDYFVCYLPFIDDHIPFCELFVIPYVLWYPFMAVVGFYLAFKDGDEFLRFFTFVFGSMSLCLIICAVFPNGQNLRPEVFPRNNALTALVGMLYSADTNTNVLPSMHVLASMATHTALWRSKTPFFQKKWVRYSSLVLTVLISVSTMFIKQHSALDCIAAVILFFPLYFLMYKYDLIAHIKNALKKKKANEGEKNKAR